MLKIQTGSLRNMHKADMMNDTVPVMYKSLADIKNASTPILSFKTKIKCGCGNIIEHCILGEDTSIFFSDSFKFLLYSCPCYGEWIPNIRLSPLDVRMIMWGRYDELIGLKSAPSDDDDPLVRSASLSPRVWNDIPYQDKYPNLVKWAKDNGWEVIG